MRLSVSRALKISHLPKSAHLIAHGCNDVLKMGFLLWLNTFFSQFKVLILTLNIDQRSGDFGEQVAKKCVKGRTEERIESSLHMNEEHRTVRDPIEQPKTRIGRRQSIPAIAIWRHD